MLGRLGGKAIWGTVYDEWIEKQGIPIHKSMGGIKDVTELERQPWARMGGSGCFILLEGTRQAWKELYVAEIPSGKALEPEKHLYDELIYVVRGRGLSEVWHEGGSKVTFEWGEGSLFAIPLNAWHRLVNGSLEPALIFAQSSAPIVMETMRNTEFVFNCSYNFTDRFTGKVDSYAAGKIEVDPKEQRSFRTWVTNFVPDMRTVMMGDWPEKVEDGQGVSFTMDAWEGVGGAVWPVGKYHKAHYHGPGAVIYGLNSEGYVLLWPKDYGIHPFQDGHGDKVERIGWKVNSIYSPPMAYFHQHFNTGKEPARHLRVTGGGITTKFPTLTVPAVGDVRQGGPVIEYEDEDPEIRRIFAGELREKGIKFNMKPVVHRTDPLTCPY